MRIRRLFWVVFITLSCGFVVLLGLWQTLPYWHSQTRNLIEVRKWIERSKPEVDSFSHTQDMVIMLYEATRLNGLVGVHVSSGTVEQFWQLRELVHGLDPPRSVEWSLELVTTDDEATRHRRVHVIDKLGAYRTTTESIAARLGR